MMNRHVIIVNCTNSFFKLNTLVLLRAETTPSHDPTTLVPTIGEDSTHIQPHDLFILVASLIRS